MCAGLLVPQPMPEHSGKASLGRLVQGVGEGGGKMDGAGEDRPVGRTAREGGGSRIPH